MKLSLLATIKQLLGNNWIMSHGISLQFCCTHLSDNLFLPSHQHSYMCTVLPGLYRGHHADKGSSGTRQYLKILPSIWVVVLYRGFSDASLMTKMFQTTTNNTSNYCMIRSLWGDEIIAIGYNKATARKQLKNVPWYFITVLLHAPVWQLFSSQPSAQLHV